MTTTQSFVILYMEGRPLAGFHTATQAIAHAHREGATTFRVVRDSDSAQVYAEHNGQEPAVTVYEVREIPLHGHEVGHGLYQTWEGAQVRRDALASRGIPAGHIVVTARSVQP